jgi:hypothetical protein
MLTQSDGHWGRFPDGSVSPAARAADHVSSGKAMAHVFSYRFAPPGDPAQTSAV